MNLCFAKYQKLSFWGGHFFANFWLFFKTHYKIRYLSTFFKAKNYKKGHFWKLLSGPSWKLLSGPSWKRLKNANLDQILTSKMFCAHIFPRKCAEATIFIVFVGTRCFRNNKLGPDNNFQKNPNLDQIITSQLDVFFVELKTGPIFIFL